MPKPEETALMKTMKLSLAQTKKAEAEQKKKREKLEEKRIKYEPKRQAKIKFKQDIDRAYLKFEKM